MKAVASLLTVFVLTCSILSQSSAVVTTDKANLRGTPSAKGRLVEKLKEDVEVEIYKVKGDWYLVQSPNFAGWIGHDDIRLNPPDTFNTSTIAVPTKLVTRTISTTPISEPPLTPAITTKSSSDGRPYFKGSRGGCYYLSGSGKKIYVDHSYCD